MSESTMIERMNDNKQISMKNKIEWMNVNEWMSKCKLRNALKNKCQYM